jgi:hypothetical protein
VGFVGIINSDGKFYCTSVILLITQKSKPNGSAKYEDATVNDDCLGYRTVQ